MIRPFDWRDVAWVHSLGRQGVALHSQESLTQGVHVLQDALRGYLAPGSKRATFVWRRNGGPGQRAFAQLQTASQNGRARVRYLAPAGADARDTPRLGLLERLASEAGERGNHHLVAEVDEASPEFELLREAGFAVYARQEIFSRASADGPSGVGLPLRRREDSDVVGIQVLYNNIVPRLVQHVEPSPTASRGGYVYVQEGELLAYLDLRRGPLGVWMQPYLHPEAHAVIDDVMQSFVGLEANGVGTPLYVCVRSYQHGLDAALAACGFARLGQQAMMVKRLVARVEQARFSMLPVLEGTEGEIASPIAKTSLSGQERRP